MFMNTNENAHIRAMHKTILQMTGVDHSFDVLEKAFFAAIAQPSVDELYLKLKPQKAEVQNVQSQIR
jgi:hypothetical protein